MTVFHLTTNAVCDENQKWFEEFRQKHQCRSCGRLARECRQRGTDVRIMGRPARSALFAVHTAIGIGGWEFLNLFEDEFSRHFVMGHVLNSRAQYIPDLVTFVPHRPILIRSSEPEYRFCAECARFVYSPSAGRSYVLRSSLQEKHVYGLDGSGLIVTREFRQRIEPRRWKSLIIEELPVLDRPLDGIDEFPEDYY